MFMQKTNAKLARKKEREAKLIDKQARAYAASVMRAEREQTQQVAPDIYVARKRMERRLRALYERIQRGDTDHMSARVAGAWLEKAERLIEEALREVDLDPTKVP